MAVCFLGITQSCINFVYKTSDPFKKEYFVLEGEVGIATNGKAIPDLFLLVKEQVNDFAGRQLRYTDVSTAVSLSQDRMMVENVEALTRQFPQMRFVFIAWQHPLNVSRYTEDISNNKQNFTRYNTEIWLKCETILFDLRRKVLIAKSVDKFRGPTRSRDVGKALIFELWDALGNDSSYPEPATQSQNMAWRSHFKRFLKEI